MDIIAPHALAIMLTMDFSTVFDFVLFILERIYILQVDQPMVNGMI